MSTKTISSFIYVTSLLFGRFVIAYYSNFVIANI